MNERLEDSGAFNYVIRAAEQARETQDMAPLQYWVEVLWNVYFAQKERSDPELFVTQCVAVNVNTRWPRVIQFQYDLHYICDDVDAVTRGSCTIWQNPRVIPCLGISIVAGDHWLRDEVFRLGASASEFDHGWKVHPEPVEEWHFVHGWDLDEVTQRTEDEADR
ncbi:MAG: hypothetical protein AAF726_18095 [Planctomycetota bacterium]